MHSPLVSIIIPTRNSSHTLLPCLRSIKRQTYTHIEIIIADQSSSDSTAEIAQKFSAKVITLPPPLFYTPPTKSRNAGAQRSQGSILYHLDSDMELSEGLIQEAVEMFASDTALGALIVHEHDITRGFWSRAKAMERKCYWGNQNIESARIVRREIFEKVGGYDEEISSGEDFDIHRRYKEVTEIGFTEHVVHHNLGQLNLFQALKKKFNYGRTAHLYFEKHASSGSSILKEELLCYIRNFKLLASNPIVALGMIVMKIGEFGCGALGYLNRKSS